MRCWQVITRIVRGQVEWDCGDEIMGYRCNRRFHCKSGRANAVGSSFVVVKYPSFMYRSEIDGVEMFRDEFVAKGGFRRERFVHLSRLSRHHHHLSLFDTIRFSNHIRCATQHGNLGNTAMNLGGALAAWGDDTWMVRSGWIGRRRRRRAGNKKRRFWQRLL